jgi:hypothetical protein
LQDVKHRLDDVQRVYKLLQVAAAGKEWTGQYRGGM